MSIQQIPSEIWYQIFDHLSLKERVKAGAVCKQWQAPADCSCKKAQIEEFNEMVMRTTKLFKQFTNKNIVDIIPELDAGNLNLDDFSSKGLHEHLDSLVLKGDCYVMPACGIVKINAFDASCFHKNYKQTVPKDRLYIHLKFQFSPSKALSDLKNFTFSSFLMPHHMPKKLFNICEGEQTAIPFKGKLVVLTAKQKEYANKTESFQDALASPAVRNGINAPPATYYIWKKDAYQKD
jgi:hypothetical protein